MKRISLRQRVCPDIRIDWPNAIDPVLRRIYLARGIDSAQQIDHGLAALSPPQALGGLDAAVDLLLQAVRSGQRIIIAGDYDCDGATGMAVAVRGLRMLGASQVGFVVPNRFEHGYGLSPALVASLVERPDMLVTVDNGIASLAGVAAARERACRVIVTDHHLPGPQFPEADAIVNPNLPGDAFPSKALAGVGVMFYLLLALRARLDEDGHSRLAARPNLAALLDLVALGTVADVVPLDRNNRVLVENGLRRIRAGRACAGIRALAEATGRDIATLTASDMGFARRATAERRRTSGRHDPGRGMSAHRQCRTRPGTGRDAFVHQRRASPAAGRHAGRGRTHGGRHAGSRHGRRQCSTTPAGIRGWSGW